MKISVIIPCYNSGTTIRNVIMQIIDTINKKDNISYEIIAVNDKSPDNVWDVLKEISAENNKVKLINLLKNTNKNGAIMAGITYSSGDYIVICDDDGQSPVKKLWELIEPLNLENVDVTVAEYVEYQQNFFKKIVTFINQKTLEIICGVPKNMKFTNFIAIKRNIVEVIIKTNNSSTYLEGLLFNITKNIENVKLKEEKRISGKSNFTLKKMINMWLDEMTEFSIRPLRISSVLGAITTFLGFIYGIIIVFQKIFNIVTVECYSSIMAAILFIGGMIMMILGIIGEYVGRIYIKVNHTPQYIIKEKINFEKEN
ncbi:MAG: glycosyltransferase [Clostridia bacterium]|nr:glycosyltransferase [Clostridia bacterium]